MERRAFCVCSAVSGNAQGNNVPKLRSALAAFDQRNGHAVSLPLVVMPRLRLSKLDQERIPESVSRALGLVKKAAAPEYNS